MSQTNVMLIGEQGAGKTSLVFELRNNSDAQHVELLNPEMLERYGDFDTGNVALTDSISQEYLSIKVKLPGGDKTLYIPWVDTAGEFWNNKQFHRDRPDEWQRYLELIEESKALVILLHPYRDLLPHSHSKHDDLCTATQWSRRLNSRLELLQNHCSRVKHILICMNKADFFCDVANEGNKWTYSKSRPIFYNYDLHIHRKYLLATRKSLKLPKSLKQKVRFFITTIKNRSLLELPWIYLGTYLNND